MGLARQLLAFGIVLALMGGLGPFAAPAHAEKRLALVVGNDVYPNLPADQQLQKAVNDSRAVGDTLERLGFEVIRGENLGRQALIDKFDELTQRISPGDVAFFFFAGHGVAIGGGNYILPSDVPNVQAGQDTRLARAALGESDIVSDLQARNVRVAVVVLDACRNNPFKRPGTRSVGTERGLTRIDAVRGVFSLYSAGVGQTALDRLSNSDANPNSVFTRVLVPALEKPGLHLSDLAVEVREEVARLASSVGHDQRPAYYDETIGGRVYLAGLPAAHDGASQPGVADPCAAAAAHWKSAQAIDNRAAYEDHLKRFPLCAFAGLARARLDQLSTKVAAVQPAARPSPSRAPASVAALGTGSGRSYVSVSVMAADRSWIATGHGDGTIRIWDVALGRATRVLRRHTDSVGALFAHPDGRTLVSAGSDDRVVAWDMTQFTVRAEVEKPFIDSTLDASKIKMSADGSTLVLATATKKVQVRDPVSLALRASHDLGYWIDSVAVSADGSRIGFVNDWNSGNNVYSFGIAEAGSGRVLHRMSRPKDPDFYRLDFADEGARLIGRDTNSRLKVFDLRAGRTAWDLASPTGGGYFEFRVLPGENRVLLIDGLTYSLRDLATGREIQRFKINWDAANAELPEHAHVVTDGNGPALMDMNTGAVVRRFDGAAQYVSQPAFLRNGRSIVVARQKAPPIVYDLATGRVEEGFGKDAVSYVRTSADGRRMILVEGARVRTVDAETAEVLQDVTLPTRLPEDFYLSGQSADLSWIVLSQSQTRRWEVWDLPNSRMRASGTYADKTAYELPVSSSLGLLATRPNWDTIDLIEADSKRSVARIASNERFQSIYDVTISPDGRTMAYEWAGTVVLYSLATRRRLARSGKFDKVEPIFLPKGDRLYIGNAILDVASGRQLLGLPDAMSAYTSSVTFSPDERLLVLTKDYGAEVFDLARQRKMASIVTFGDGEWAVLTAGGYVGSSGAARHLVVESGSELLTTDDGFRTAWLRDAMPLEAALGR